MTYKTKSLSLAACLYAYPKIEFVGVNSSNLQNIYFVFKPAEKVKEFVNNYYTGKAEGNLRDTFEGYKTLKDLVFELKNGQKK